MGGSVIWKMKNIDLHLLLDEKIIVISILHPFESSFEVMGRWTTDFWSKIQNPGLQKSMGLALFRKKTFMHFGIKPRNQFVCYLHHFYIIVKLMTYVFTLHEEDKFTEPLRSPLVCWNLTSRKKNEKIGHFQRRFTYASRMDLGAPWGAPWYRK